MTKFRPKLQIALDTDNWDDAFEILDKVVEHVDIVEFGTPLVKAIGLEKIADLISEFKEKPIYKDKEYLIDTKTMDVPAFEGQMCFDKANAKYMTVMGLAPNASIKESIKYIKDEHPGRAIFFDLMNIPKHKKGWERVTKLVRLHREAGLTAHLGIHSGISEQLSKKGGSPILGLRTLRGQIGFPDDVEIAVAGGINLDTVKQVLEMRPNVVIVGGAITKANNPKAAAKSFKKKLALFRYKKPKKVIEDLPIKERIQFRMNIEGTDKKILAVLSDMRNKHQLLTNQLAFVVARTFNDKDNQKALAKFLYDLLQTERRTGRPKTPGGAILKFGRLFFTFMRSLVEKKGLYTKIRTVGYGRSEKVSHVFYNRLEGLGLYSGLGRIGSISNDEILVAISGSGTTEIAVECANTAKNKGGKVLAITYSPKSPLAITSDYFIDMKIGSVDEDKSLTPLGTLFELSSLIFLECLVPTIQKLLSAPIDAMKEEQIRALIDKRIEAARKDYNKILTGDLRSVVSKTLNDKRNEEAFIGALYSLMNTFTRGGVEKQVHVIGYGRGHSILHFFKLRLEHLGAHAQPPGEDAYPQPYDVIFSLFGEEKERDTLKNTEKLKDREKDVITVAVANRWDSNLHDIEQVSDFRIMVKLGRSRDPSHRYPRGFAFEISSAIIFDCMISMMMKLCGLTNKDLEGKHSGVGGTGNK